MTPALLTYEDFAPAVGEPFAVRLTDADVTLTLTQARPLSSASGNERVPFALLFAGPQEVPLPQATYALVHERLGEQLVFIVPVAPGEYEAIFT